MISDLQLSLLGAAVAGIAAVWGYNAWQERKYRKAAEHVFRRVDPDPLAQGEDSPQYGTDLTADVSLDDERIEPSLSIPEQLAGRAPDVAAESPSAGESFQIPAAPADLVDSTIEVVGRLEFRPAIRGAALMNLMQGLVATMSKPVRIAAFAESGWREIEVGDENEYVEACATVQLADRKGPLSVSDLDAFINALETFAAQHHSALDRFVSVSVLDQAQTLDRFCADVDLQIALHVVPSGSAGFAGSKLHGLVEAMGFTLAKDGAFQMTDDSGSVLFTLSNFDSTPLVPEQLQSTTVQGLSFWLDVPRVAQGGAAYDRMVATAQKFAETLGGILVDDQRGPLANSALVAIRKKIVEIQDEMGAAGIPAGGRRALRLFV